MKKIPFYLDGYEISFGHARRTRIPIIKITHSKNGISIKPFYSVNRINLLEIIQYETGLNDQYIESINEHFQEVNYP
ncbi:MULTISPECIES: hypothetical protein [Photorhabdus]|uniref:Uncharacterized protein n=2 Tax=Photorhabdus TaxID=29487 RepID=A0ABX0AUZ0_9GAMM|nr:MULTISPECIES: hypothetical protein [Photorhabdus]MCT8352557.1 hypothetical protein [Photorhabdus kayaii]MDB6367756.1 hypothetical protein [Photorhabdus bodei]MDB6372415.1 hypothetical protein [Photorhabdus bodei]NDL12085.1 hypothetical protein [Photorhabdus kayaii]NDL24623.1 hypothetical protein [Photorhabdus kayaii]